jgi:hypothetical protein
MNLCCRADVQLFTVPADPEEWEAAHGGRPHQGETCLVTADGEHVCCRGDYAFSPVVIGRFYCLECDQTATEKHPPLPAPPELLGKVIAARMAAPLKMPVAALRRENRKVAKSPSAAIRFKVFRRDKFRCVYCGRSPAGGGPELVLDHRDSRANGGEEGLGNYVTACAECNSGKGSASVSAQELTL